MSKTECKAAEDMTEAVSLFHVTYVSCKKHNSFLHLCKNEFPSLVRLDGGNHAAT